MNWSDFGERNQRLNPLWTLGAGMNLGELQPYKEMIALSVYLHGCAGDLAAQERGEHSVLAGDLMDKLSCAFMSLGNKSSIA